MSSTFFAPDILRIARRLTALGTILNPPAKSGEALNQRRPSLRRARRTLHRPRPRKRPQHPLSPASRSTRSAGGRPRPPVLPLPPAKNPKRPKRKRPRRASSRRARRSQRSPSHRPPPRRPKKKKSKSPPVRQRPAKVTQSPAKTLTLRRRLRPTRKSPSPARASPGPLARRTSSRATARALRVRRPQRRLVQVPGVYVRGEDGIGLRPTSACAASIRTAARRSR